MVLLSRYAATVSAAVATRPRADCSSSIICITFNVFLIRNMRPCLGDFLRNFIVFFKYF